VKRTGLVLGVNLLLGAAALAWVLRRFGAPAIALLARGPSALGLAGVLVAIAAGLGLDALRWRILLDGLGVRPALLRLALLRAAGQSVGAVLPSAKLGGEPLRMYLCARAGVGGPDAVASVAVDRTLEIGASTAFACVFAVVLLGAGVPGLTGALVTVGLAAVGVAAGAGMTARRLARGAGLVTALARTVRVDRLGAVGSRLDVIEAAERAAARLVAEPRRLGRAFASGVAANLVVLVEYYWLLGAFGLPADPLAVVGAIFATGAAHALPVPGAVGALEGAIVWLFGVLGHPPEVGLAVGLAVRLRELVWVAPGLAYVLGVPFRRDLPWWAA